MLNTAQNKKLLVKLTRALETYEPYVFTEICTLPFSMYETSERLTDVPEAALFQDPVQRPQGRLRGGGGRHRVLPGGGSPPPKARGARGI